MAVYLIADVKVTDDSWIPEYAVNVHNIVHKHGGKYLSRTSNITTIEGEELDTSLIALLEFPSLEAVQAFVKDPAYAHTSVTLGVTEGEIMNDINFLVGRVWSLRYRCHRLHGTG